MPASETFWRPLKKMHVIFAVSSFALAAVTFWMMADDYSSEWRGHQKVVDKLNALKLNASLLEFTSADNYEDEVAQLAAQIDEAKKNVKSQQKEIDKQEAEVARLKLALSNAEREIRTRRAVRDKSRADYDLGVRDELPEAKLKEYFEKFTADQATVDRLEREAETHRKKYAAAKEKLDKITKRRDELEAEKKSLEAREVQIRDAINSLEPDNPLVAAKRMMLDLPILEGFSQIHKIQMDWLPNLQIRLGMSTTARFDRCRTCHISIDRVEAGNVPTFPHGDVDSQDPKEWVEENKFPHPYATHPRPELYLTAASPHPVQTFGCTICHDGQGSATNFNNAQHGPNDPHQEEEWEEKYHHHYNHFWEYPMLSKRFQESSCLKCHHDVVELGVNPKFGASAPKLFHGYQLLQKYGCFGCHEIHGFTGGEAIGPDVRLEPNYNAAALELLNTLAGDKSESKMATEIRGLAHEVADAPVDTAESRNRLRDVIAADAKSPSPLLSAAVHRMADDFKDVEVPGRYRKVGPSLRYIASKTTPGWIEHWTEEPKRFRPTTRMPQFFGNTNQQDAHAAALMPVELTSIAEYLINKTQPLDLLSPAPIEVDGESQPYEPDAKRGKELFAQQGCLACHSHKDFPKITADFGPDLSKVHAKMLPGEAGFNWMYTWLRDPKRYHPRTKMPNLFLTQKTVGETTVDPAADIAAYLLAGGPEDYKQYRPKPYLGLEVEAVGGKGAGVRVVRVLPLSPASRATGIKPHLGLDVEAAPEGQAGVRVLPSSPALHATDDKGNAADVRADDVVRKYGGKTVSSAEALQKMVAATPLGSRSQLEVVRGKAVIQRYVVLDGLPAVIRPGDVVRKIAGKPVNSTGDLEAVVTDASAGRRVAIEVFRNGSAGQLSVIIGNPLDDMVRLFLTKSVGVQRTEEFLQTRKYPGDPQQIKGDEIELVAHGKSAPTDAEWLQLKLNYVGRRTISRYGCYGCHDIPGFEQARPIGTTLQDWGRKDTSKLALEHIEEYLHHHGEPDGSSTKERVEQAIKDARAGGLEAGEFESAEAEAREMSTASLYEKLMHHRREGFLWQKLRQPRSYDYRKVETKGYDERLRMPKFPFSEAEIEAISTFVLGLVAEPPAEQYVYQPTGAAKARIDGEFLLEKYNCAGCHMLELPQAAFALEMSGGAHPFGELIGNSADEIAEWFVVHRKSLNAADKKGPIKLASFAEFAGVPEWIVKKAIAEVERVEKANEGKDREKDKDELEKFDIKRVVRNAPLRVRFAYRMAGPESIIEQLEAVGVKPEGSEKPDEPLSEEAAKERAQQQQVAFGKWLSGQQLVTIVDDVQRMQRLGAPIDEIVRLTNDEDVSDTDKTGLRRLTDSVRTWLDEHPEYMLAADLKPAEGETREGIARLLRLKPPVKAATGKTRENGEPILTFHGLLMEPPDLEEDPEFQAYNYRTWETLDVAGRILLPNYNLTQFRPQLEPDLMEQARGGNFALWLVERLANDRSNKASRDRGWAWSMSPPPLYLEGIKVQTPWLYKFLKNPHVIRHEVVLRMPRFNLDDNEARALANYFAAVDDSRFPYQETPQREPVYLDQKNSSLAEMIPPDSSYLSESWKLLNANVCMGCHSVGGKPFVSGPGVDPKKVTHGPDLNRVHERLRPDWLALWITKPMWITPYTKMVVPKAEPSLLGGDRPVQMEALRDALLNYPLLIERDGAIFYDPNAPEGERIKPASEAVAAPPAAE